MGCNGIWCASSPRQVLIHGKQLPMEAMICVHLCETEALKTNIYIYVPTGACFREVSPYIATWKIERLTVTSLA